MSETRATKPVFPPGRYGRRRSGARHQALPAVVLVLVLAASALLSVVLYQRFGQTDYRPQIVGWQQPTDNQMIIKFWVRVPAGRAASCILRVRDHAGNEVGRRTVVVRAAPDTTVIETAEPVDTTSRGSVGDVPRCRPTD